MTKRSLVLGINCFVHDSSAALVEEGHILAAAEEERFCRKKHTGKFPVEAIGYCLKEAGASWKDVRQVAFSFDPFLQLRKRFFHGLRHFPKTLQFGRYSSGLFSPFFLRQQLRSAFPESAGSPFKIHFVNHHLAHAASSFFASGFERAAILTVDGAGEWATTVLSAGDGNKIKILEEINYPHSLGFLYGAVTQFLGFRSSYDEGKVMALAAYAEPCLEKDFEKLIHLESDGRFRLNLEYFDFHLGSRRWYSEKLVELWVAPRASNGPIQKHHYQIAATLQAVIEKALLGLANRLYRQTGLTDLCLAGGVALNCSANGALLRQSPFKRIFVQPASGDGGTSLGAALLISHASNGALKNGKTFSAYLGPSFNDEEIEQVLLNEGLTYERFNSIEERVADLLAEGKTIGWFQGRMEYGPRALGARSILADPRMAEKRHYLNREIKGRESFRPFGPSVLEEEAGHFFEINQKSPFMLFAAKIKSESSSLIPAVLHEDGTSRIQTVSKSESPLYWKLIRAFQKRTGIPLLLNTSFNLKDEPIVCRPIDAARSFKRSRLDFLAIGPFLARRGPK